ncbi:MAG: YggT family protein [Candidatus Nanopelagicales bacterium]|nr:YggT family protein [Candidatus Nanopelagicales bacterium]MCF8550446.1 YggT family protein [Candidatus Nanopelagicales bacterium]
MSEVGNIIATLLSIYLIILIGRLVFDFVQIFARDWRPHGFILIIVEGIYTVTEPPLRLIRRVVPPIRLGQVSLDLGFLILLIGIQILMGILRSL